MKMADTDSRVLKAIFFLDTPTRRDIAEYAGLSVVSVTAVLARLMERGDVVIAGKSGSGGRPSAIYRIAGGFNCTVGVYIGARRIQIVGVDAYREIVDQQESAPAISKHSADPAADLIDQVAREVARFTESERMRGQHVLAVGLAVPGMVDTERGIWLRGLQLTGVENMPIGNMLQRALNLPVVVEDPARCVAFLKASTMGADAAGDFVLLHLDRGVGASVVMKGELYRGNHGLAGEIGHLVVDKGGARCSCGNVGCLETVLSEPAILRRFQQRLSEGVISALQRTDAPDLTIEHILSAAQADDRLAQSTLFELGAFLGNACTMLIHMYNPRTLVVDGRVAALGDYFREAAWQTIRQQVVPEMLVDLNIEYDVARQGDEAKGAALIAQRWAWRNLYNLSKGK